MSDLPFTFTLNMPGVIPSRIDNHIQRKLSALKGQFYDQQAFNEMLAEEDRLIYEVYEVRRPEVEGEMLMGVFHCAPWQSRPGILYDQRPFPFCPGYRRGLLLCSRRRIHGYGNT